LIHKPRILASLAEASPADAGDLVYVVNAPGPTKLMEGAHIVMS
jgi:hypothetical protein